MDRVFNMEYFGKMDDIQDFLASNLNADDPLSSELSSIPSYENDLNFCFGDRLERQDSDHGLSAGTKKIQKERLDKKKYQNISNELRLELIDAVMNKKEKIKHAAKRLGINYSSAKYIYQIYRKEGRKDKIIFKKKTGRDEGVDHVQNGTVYTSSVSNVFSTQNYSILQQERDLSMTYHTNWTIPEGSLGLPVQLQSGEILEANKEIIVQNNIPVQVLINNKTPQDNLPEQYNHVGSQNSLKIAEQMRQTSAGSQADNNTLYQNSSYGQPMPATMAHSTQAPITYMLPYQTPQGLNPNLIPQGQINPNMLFYRNNPHPNQTLLQNVLLPQNFQAYPVYNPAHGVQQPQTFPMMQAPFYTPLQNNISFPMHVQAPSIHNQAGVPIMVYFVENPGPPQADGALNLQTDNK